MELNNHRPSHNTAYDFASLLQFTHDSIFYIKRFVIIEDVVSSGGAIVAAVDKMRKDNIEVNVAICVIDRETGGKENLAAHGITLISLLTRKDLDDIV